MKTQEPPAKPRDPFRLRRSAAVLAAVALLLGSLWFAEWMAPEPIPASAPWSPPRLILDPGHGGIDGGAIAYDGTRESDLNLAIALKLRELAAFYGLDVVMTREDDSRRTEFIAYSEHEDLEHRAELINAVGGGICLSIHQNCFPTSQPSGAQVLYGPGEDSRRLGELTQQAIVSALQPENRRLAEPASAGLYLTSHVSCPIALVECGFVSNLTDLQKLCREQYQRALAAVLLSACLQYTFTPV